MSQTVNYKKTVPEIILDLFRDNLGVNIFKRFMIGDPIILPLSELPALVVHEPNTKYDFGPTGFDDIEHELLIQAIFNKKDDFGAPSDHASLDQIIDQIVQGRDPTTGDFVPDSLLGVLRKNVTLGNLVVEHVDSVEKGVIQRSETLITAEAHIHIRVNELQSIASRS